MIVSVYEKKENGAELIAETPFKTEKKEKPFQIIDRFMSSAGEGLFGKKVKSCGIRKIWNEGDHQSTWHHTKGNSGGYYGRNESLISPSVCKEDSDEWQGSLILTDGNDDFDTGRYIGLEFHEEGYVISTGKEVSNMFGMSFPSYIYNIGKSKVRSASRSSARIFADRKKLLNFLQKNENVFKYFVSSHGWIVNVEPASQKFRECDEAKIECMTKKQQENVKKTDSLIEEIVVRINEAAPKEEVYSPAENTEDEIFKRMDSIGLSYKLVTSPFLNQGKIFMSEFGGILYEPDEGAKHAMEEAKRYGCTPYHVIKTGDMYAVLYISGNREEWEMEQYDKKTEAIMALVYNKAIGISEFGDIGVRSANGGLTRTF